MVWCDGVWCDGVWCGVVWCGVMGCGVMGCGVMGCMLCCTVYFGVLHSKLRTDRWMRRC